MMMTAAITTMMQKEAVDKIKEEEEYKGEHNAGDYENANWLHYIANKGL